MRISNRLAALLLLLGMILVFIGGYLYFYVYFVSSLKITSNIEGYTVDLYAPSIAQTFTHECAQTGCSISNISPFEYVLTAKKAGYVDIVKNIDLKGAKQETFSIEFKKLVTLEPYIEEPQQTEKQDKIDFLKIKAKSLLTFDLKSHGILYFEEEGDYMDLYRSFSGTIDKISTFNKTSANEILLTSILPDEKEILITVGKLNYLYNIGQNSLKQIDLSVPVVYAKTGEFPGEYQLVTEKGTYLYYSVSGKVEYSSIFFDYIYVGDGQYVGYVAGDDIVRRKNFSFEKEPENTPLLVFYDQNTLKKEVFYRLTNELVKIYKKGDKYIILDTSGIQLELKGL